MTTKWSALAVLRVFGLQSDPNALLESLPLSSVTVHHKGESGLRKRVHSDSGLTATIVDADSIGALHHGLARYVESSREFHAAVVRLGGGSLIDVGLMVPGEAARAVTFEPALLRAMADGGIGLVVSGYPDRRATTMQNRRNFIRGAAASAGALTVLSSGNVQAASEPTMSLNVIYPNHAGAKFDTAYYRATHIPLAMKVMKARSVLLIEGLPMAEGAAAPFAMIAHFEFTSAEAMKAGLADPGMAEVRADVAKFTDIKPTVMVGRSVESPA